eukprot:gene11032-12196_t
MSLLDFNGLAAAPVSPMKVDGDVNPDIIKDYAEHLFSQNVKGVFVCGTTGEGHLLTIPERKLLAEKWMEHRKGRLDCIIIQCGCEQISYAKELASHAESIHADAVACISPSYFKPNNIDSLIAFLSEVAASAPNTPFLYYHIPQMTGVIIDMDVFLEKAVARIPNFAGLKFSSTVLLDFKRGLDYEKKKLSVFYGGDEQLFGAIVMGGTCAVGSTYSYLGNTSNRMLEAVKNGDLETARKEQEYAQKVIKILFKHGGHNGVHKAILELCGLQVGPPRLPIMPLSPKEKESLREDLNYIGFFEARK